MKLVRRLKGFVESVPEPVGRMLSLVPYSWKLGGVYGEFRRLEADFYSWGEERKRDWVFGGLKRIVDYAYANVPFYGNFYRKHGFHPQDLKSFADWTAVPVVSKSDFQAFDLESRTGERRGSYKTTTGGTSGKALDLYLDRQAFAREWAHMHAIWGSRGYRPSDVKLTLRGKYFDDGRAVRYNAVHNEYVVNAAVPLDEAIRAVSGLRRFGNIRWLHGYPSLVAEFATVAEGLAPEFLAAFRQQLKGVLLGSEFPAPIYREPIERLLSPNVVSWYGHTEMAVLAGEISPGVYKSLPTYGFAEALSSNGRTTLVATSFHNRAHPFIRYDTEDQIERLGVDDLSMEFRIDGGRRGDFIVMRNGGRQSLTALFFGRHHVGYELVRHIQIRQRSPGSFTLIVVPRGSEVSVDDIRNGFDFSGLDVDWDVELVAEPVRSAAGKIRLKVE